MYLQPQDIWYDKRLVIRISVPSCPQVCRCGGRIYDRNHDSDVDITDVADLGYKLYAQKQDSFYVNKVFPGVGLEALRPDIIERARKMSRIRKDDHPWLTMTDEELLRSAGLILEDFEQHTVNSVRFMLRKCRHDRSVLAKQQNSCQRYPLPVLFKVL